MNEIMNRNCLSGRLIPGTRNNLSVREETATYSYANHNLASDVLPFRGNDMYQTPQCNSRSISDQPLVPYNGFPPTPLLPPIGTPALQSPLTNAVAEGPNAFEDEFTCFKGNDTSDLLIAAKYNDLPPTTIVPPIGTPALQSPLTNAGVEGPNAFEDESTCFNRNEPSDFLMAAEQEDRNMSSNNKEMSMTSNSATLTSQEGRSFADDNDVMSDFIELDKDVLLAEMVLYSTVVFNKSCNQCTINSHIFFSCT